MFRSEGRGYRPRVWSDALSTRPAGAVNCWRGPCCGPRRKYGGWSRCRGSWREQQAQRAYTAEREERPWQAEENHGHELARACRMAEGLRPVHCAHVQGEQAGRSLGQFPVGKDRDREESGRAAYGLDAESGVRVTGAEQILRIIKGDQLGRTPSARRCAIVRFGRALECPANRRPGGLEFAWNRCTV